jgi:REP element-mobilizing transposase RayT
MGRPLRYFEEEGWYFVTARTFQSRLLLKPTRQMGEALGGVLARAANRCDVRLAAFVAASNHLHLLVHTRGASLSRFMQFLLGNASKKAGPLVGWRGQFWERRYSAERVLDDGAMEGRLKYILAHGVKEGLVRRVSDWPGLSSLPQLLGEPKRRFRFYEWARRWESGKLIPGGEYRWASEWATDEELELHPLPAWAGWTAEHRQARVRQLITDVEAEGRRKHRTVLGPRALLEQEPLAPPAKSKHSPRPWFHAAERALGFHFMAGYAVYVNAFRRASQLFRLGRWTEAQFPPFAFRPWVPARV